MDLGLQNHIYVFSIKQDSHSLTQKEAILAIKITFMMEFKIISIFSCFRHSIQLIYLCVFLIYCLLLSNMNQIVGEKYVIGRKLGEGAFGKIFLGSHLENKKQVAIKLEQVKCPTPQLFYEAKLLAYINRTVPKPKGFADIYYCGREGQYNILVMQLLGPSLEQLFNFCNKKFDLKTTLLIGIQILQRLEILHQHGFIHRDIKPDNFLLGINTDHTTIYIVDFGLAKRYLNKEGKHIPYKDNKSLTGTARYASVNTHLGIEQGRRDDIQSLGYVLIYFLKGVLPWQNLRGDTRQQKYQRIMQKKISLSVQNLCRDLPRQFQMFINKAKNTFFDQKPDYGYFRELLQQMIHQNGYSKDSQYCWIKLVKAKHEQGEFDF